MTREEELAAIEEFVRTHEIVRQPIQPCPHCDRMPIPAYPDWGMSNMSHALASLRRIASLGPTG